MPLEDKIVDRRGFLSLLALLGAGCVSKEIIPGEYNLDYRNENPGSTHYIDPLEENQPYSYTYVRDHVFYSEHDEKGLITIYYLGREDNQRAIEPNQVVMTKVIERVKVDETYKEFKLKEEGYTNTGSIQKSMARTPRFQTVDRRPGLWKFLSRDVLGID